MINGLFMDVILLFKRMNIIMHSHNHRDDTVFMFITFKILIYYMMLKKNLYLNIKKNMSN